MDKTAVICGHTQIANGVQIKPNTTVTGDIVIAKGVQLGNQVVINGSGTIGEGTIIEDGATINGTVNLVQAKIKRGASFNGDFAVSNAELSGRLGCTGNGSIQGACPKPAEEKAVPGSSGL